MRGENLAVQSSDGRRMILQNDKQKQVGVKNEQSYLGHFYERFEPSDQAGTRAAAEPAGDRNDSRDGLEPCVLAGRAQPGDCPAGH